MDDEAPVRHGTRTAPVSCALMMASMPFFLPPLGVFELVDTAQYPSPVIPSHAMPFQQIVVLRKSHLSLEDVQDAAEEGESKLMPQPGVVVLLFYGLLTLLRLF